MTSVDAGAATPTGLRQAANWSAVYQIMVIGLPMARAELGRTFAKKGVEKGQHLEGGAPSPPH